MTEATKKGGTPLHVLMLLGFALGLGAGLWVNVAIGGGYAWDGAKTVVASK